MAAKLLLHFTIFTILISSIGCTEDPFIAFEPNESYNADERLWSYFQRFEEEGLSRGVDVDLNTFGILGIISDIPERGVAGQCQYGRRISKEITIDQNFWNRADDLSREFVVFHELGHCFLLRDHIEDSFQNGLCVSIMRSGLGNCNDAYNYQNRAYYLDELFSVMEI